MERRRDPRHLLRYPFSLRCLTTKQVIDGQRTEDISASGLRFEPRAGGALAAGDPVEVKVLARVELPAPHNLLVLAARARVVRSAAGVVALAFDCPLAV